MTDDQRIHRAVGIIVWGMTTPDRERKRCLTPEEACAKAQAREPDLDDECIAGCLRWAQAAIKAAEMFKVAPPEMTLAEILDRAGVPWRE